MNIWPSDFTKTFQNRWFLRAVSLLIALVLWVFVGWDGNTVDSHTFEVPVKYNNLPKGYSISKTTSSIRVIVEGRLVSLATMDRGAIVAGIDLRELQPGKYRLPVRLDLPSEVHLKSSKPQMIEFELTRIVERTIPVHYRLEGQIINGKILRSVDITPKEVTLKGSETQVMAVHDAVVEIPVSKIKGSVKQQYPVKLSSSQTINAHLDTREIELNPSQITVFIVIEDEIKGKRIPFRVRLEGTPDPEWEVASVKVTPSHITFRHIGNEPLQIKEWLLPSVDISNIHEDMKVTLPLNVSSDDVELEGAENVRVEVKVRRISEVRTLLNVPIRIIGEHEGRQWKLLEPLASVTIEQDSNIYKNAKQDEIPFELYVDVTNIVSDQIKLPVLPGKLWDGVKILGINPDMVTAVASEMQTFSEDIGE